MRSGYHDGRVASVFSVPYRLLYREQGQPWAGGEMAPEVDEEARERLALRSG